jgi:8-oxo-dGTP pyrophosphatase MutT (NUDIX family)
MLERLTARVLLLDPDDRLLLARGRLPADPDGPSFWFTVGGGAEPGETLLEAAAREVLEETGFTDVQFGPVVWYDEVILADVSLTQMLFRQHYIVARTHGGALSRAGWQAYEHDLTDEMRWWRLGEIQASAETFYPEGLAELLPDVLAGRISPQPLVIRTLDGPVRPLPRPPGEAP